MVEGTFVTAEIPREESILAGAEPFTLDGIDDDIRADLIAVGVDLANPDLLAQQQREAAAALFLRHICVRDQRIADLERSMELEIDLVTRHYARLIAKPTQERAAFVRQVELMAELSAVQKGFGKKKSASTPFGTFGIRHSGATVELTDAAALLEHLKASDPTKVKVTAVLPLNEAREYLSPEELAKTKMEPRWSDVKATLDPEGELPPGVAKVPETVTPFAKPEAPTWMLQGGRPQ
jgi:phage host-nuclease inhibitor protein Gam